MTDAAAWRRRWAASMPGALYLHVPFCARRCLYCDFASAQTAAGDPLMAAYRAALSSQLAELDALGLLGEVDTAYVGGGTPTMLGEADLSRLVSDVASRTGATELTCEANPESLPAPMACAIADAGATRVSVGVQSAVDAELRAIGRIHDSARALAALRDAAAAGLDVSADLMCGIPLQTAGSWRESLEAVVATGVGHLSVYPLALEQGTPLEGLVSRGELAAPDPDLQADCMEEAARMLAAAGMRRYEVASHARPGAECRHNEAYWTGVGYLGLGTAAAGMLSRVAYERLRPAMPQLPELPEDVVRVRTRVLSATGRIASDPRLASLDLELELLGEGQAAAEDLMLGCRMVAGVGVGLLEAARDALGAEAVDGALADVVSRALARPTRDGGLAPTRDGWLLGNELYGAMWGLAPAPVEARRLAGA